MSLDPAIFAALLAAGAPPPPDADVVERRRLMDVGSDRVAEAATEPGPASVSVVEHQVPSIDGTTSSLVRLYLPVGTPVGAHLLLHGGSWAQGTPAGAAIDATARERAAAAQVIVASAAYRLAPENPFPSGLQDVLAAWRWLLVEGERHGVAGGSISVGGQSAGANLAAALCLMLREQGDAQPLLQLLEVPFLDLSLQHLAEVELPEVADTSGLGPIISEYTDSIDVTDPYVSPLLADDLSGLAPAHIMVAEHDPLRGDGEAYARRLADAGGVARCTTHVGHVHVSPVMTKTFAPARAWRSELLDVLRTTHAA